MDFPEKKGSFLITYAITFSNFVLSFGSQLCRLQKHHCNVYIDFYATRKITNVQSYKYAPVYA